jgi:pentatricopeptide repeat domain-containing protein 1
MKKRGFDPAESHFTALFNSCANSPWKADGLQRAILLRQQLKDRNVLLNRAQYHAMIKGDSTLTNVLISKNLCFLSLAFGHCGDIETALQIMNEMASNHITITTDSFNFLLQACISSPEEGFTRAILVES